MPVRCTTAFTTLKIWLMGFVCYRQFARAVYIKYMHFSTKSSTCISACVQRLGVPSQKLQASDPCIHALFTRSGFRSPVHTLSNWLFGGAYSSFCTCLSQPFPPLETMALTKARVATAVQNNILEVGCWHGTAYIVIFTIRANPTHS
jgi:hypothetical protein